MVAMAQPPPLLQLSDIALTFGGAPLLHGAEPTGSAGGRGGLGGRKGPGKPTRRRIAAGLVEPDAGKRFVQPGVAIRYLPQEPDRTGFGPTGGFAEGGVGPADDPF